MIDKSKVMASVLGKLKGEPKAPEADPKSVGKEAAVIKLFSALKGGDVKSGVAALEDFLSLCGDEE
jgi:hypothetical protein